jgi:hypothetical protein
VLDVVSDDPPQPAITIAAIAAGIATTANRLRLAGVRVIQASPSA